MHAHQSSYMSDRLTFKIVATKAAITLFPWRDSQSMLKSAQISHFRDARNQQSEIAGILG
ncbi:MAG: hypothetical protein V7K27_16135 [Nostoc sp.]|uniref:hypothetical protein n=1 Tax=Nostoc sp. TaxID=1180 RepID=UPI002FFD11EC